jgi:Ser/Thr protein kinase RdoA (MazF antagonist)
MKQQSYILNYIRENYGLSGVLNDLPSYIDKNYLLSTNDGDKYVVKISSQQTPTQEVELENAAMNHVSIKGLSFQTPVVIKSLSGEELLDFSDLDNKILKFRIVSFLKGHLYSQVDNNNPDLQASLGVLIAEITQAFSDFEHPVANRELLWDLVNLHKIEPLLEYFEGDKRQILERILNNILNHTIPILKQQPQQVIHNDVNNTNLIAGVVDGKLSCTGLFDFGDMVYTQRICELAIGMAYALMEQKDILFTAKNIVTAYQTNITLSDDELMILPELIKARLLQSIIVSGKSYFQDPSNEYLLISVAPAWELLHKLDKLKPNEFVQSIS